MSDIWKKNLIGAGTPSPFGSYISERDRTTLSRRHLVRGSKNVYFKRTGGISVRPGLLRRGSADATEAGVLASHEWETSLGAVLPLRVSDGNLQVESDIVTSGTYVWYTLLSGLTNTRLIFDEWWDNTAKKDILLFCDGTDNLKTWSGGIGLIDSTTANTISFSVNAATLGFSGSGTVIINGTEYTYSGVSGTDLTGLGSDPTGEANGSVVLDKPETNTDTVEDGFDIDFIKVVENQLYCGSETSRLVYISKNNDFDNFNSSSPRASGEGDTIVCSETPVGIGERDGMAIIGSNKAWYEVSFDQITVGTDLSEQTLVTRKPMANKKGALRHEFITNAGDDLIYLTVDQQLHKYGTFRNINQPQFPSLSDQVKDELKNEDFTGGHMRSIGDFVYLTAPNNGRVWLHETRTTVTKLGNLRREQLWHPPFIWNLSRIAEISGVEYGHSNANPQLYQMWDTLQWHDDSPSDEDLPYDCVAAFAYWTGNRHDLLIFDQLFCEGKMTPGTNLSGAVVYEYKGERATQQVIINGENESPEFYIGSVGIALGDSSLGDNPLGDETTEVERDEELVPKFKTIRQLEEQNVTEYQVRLFSTEAGSRWELFTIGTNEVISEEKPSYFITEE